MYRTGYFTLGPTLHPFLASARHMIGLVGVVFVLTFTAIELVPLPALTVQIVVAMEDILARVSPQPLIVACAPVEDILAPASPEHLVVAFAPVDHVIALGAGQEVFARSSVERVLAAVSGGLYADRPGPGPRPAASRAARRAGAACPGGVRGGPLPRRARPRPAARRCPPRRREHRRHCLRRACL